MVAELEGTGSCHSILHGARLHTTGAIEGLIELRSHYSLPSDSIQVDWIYARYKDIIENDLSNSRRLQAKGLHEVVAGLAQYCYGRVNSATNKMTSALFYS